MQNRNESTGNLGTYQTAEALPNSAIVCRRILTRNCRTQFQTQVGAGAVKRGESEIKNKWKIKKERFRFRIEYRSVKQSLFNKLDQRLWGSLIRDPIIIGNIFVFLLKFSIWNSQFDTLTYSFWFKSFESEALLKTEVLVVHSRHSRLEFLVYHRFFLANHKFC